MSKATGILITFDNGDRHIITATPGAQQNQYFSSITRWFDSLAHDGDHDHERFTRIRLRRGYSFDPATVKAQVWPDVVSYLAQYEVDADPERDAEDEYYDSFTFELIPLTEPFNAPRGRRKQNEPWAVTCEPVISFVTKRNKHTGELMLFDGVDALSSTGELGFEAHRVTPECSSTWSSEPACPHAAEHLQWLKDAEAKRQAEQEQEQEQDA